MWDTRVRTCQSVLDHPLPVTAVSTSADGKEVYTGCVDGAPSRCATAGLLRWETACGDCLRSILASLPAVRRLHCPGPSRPLASECLAAGCVRVYDLRKSDGEPKLKLRGHDDIVTGNRPLPPPSSGPRSCP